MGDLTRSMTLTGFCNLFHIKATKKNRGITLLNLVFVEA